MKAAAHFYDVLYSTLAHRMSGRPTVEETVADKRKLSPEQEEKLVQWILNADAQGLALLSNSCGKWLTVSSISPTLPTSLERSG